MSNECSDKDPFVLRVHGDSMLPEFPDGSIIVVDPTQPAKAGDYVVARINEMIELRKLYVENGIYVLKTTASPDADTLVSASAQLIGRVAKKTDIRKSTAKYFA